jgi:hypothetical protein
LNQNSADFYQLINEQLLENSYEFILTDKTLSIKVEESKTKKLLDELKVQFEHFRFNQDAIKSLVNRKTRISNNLVILTIAKDLGSNAGILKDKLDLLIRVFMNAKRNHVVSDGVDFYPATSIAVSNKFQQSVEDLIKNSKLVLTKTKINS